MGKSLSDGGLLDEAIERLPDAVRLRRQLHQHPEIGLHLPATQDAILANLQGLPVTTRLGTTTSSVTAVLEGEKPGPTILLRADMDALPMPEDTGFEFSSRVENAMHACGHDLHVAMLMGAAHMLSERRGELAGRVLFMFQPGEEGYHGARFMLEDGLLDGVGEVTSAFAIHASPSVPAGTIAIKGGSLMASADQLFITIVGRGGHASAPHHALDPIPVACEIVQAIQTMITRSVDAFDPAVVTIAQIVAGTTSNVIPETAKIIGTIRAVSEHTRRLVHDNLRRVADGIAAAHGASVEFEIEHGYPVTINHVGPAAEVSRIATDILGPKRVINIANPVMGAEDFSYVLQRVPGAMAFLGATPVGGDPRTAAPNHSNRAVFNEESMSAGIALYTAVALDHLQ